MNTGFAAPPAKPSVWSPLVASLLLVLLGACGAHRTDAVQLSPAAEEDELFAAVLDAYGARWNRPWMVVHAFTEPMVRPDLHTGTWQRIASLPGIAESTLAEFEACHTERRRIGPLPPTRARVTLVEESDLTDLPANDRFWHSEMWVRYQAKFDGAVGIHALSRAGFSADRRQAVVIVRYNCGTRCGIIIALLLTRDAEGWRAVEQVGLSFH